MRGARLACVKPAASVCSEPGSNSHVENSIIGIYVTSLNRRELHTLLPLPNKTPKGPVWPAQVRSIREDWPKVSAPSISVTSLDKRDRQSLFQRSSISTRSRQAPPPTFLFLLYMQLSKNRPKPQNLSQKLTQRDNRLPANHPSPVQQFLKKPQNEAVRRQQRRRPRQ